MRGWYEMHELMVLRGWRRPRIYIFGIMEKVKGQVTKNPTNIYMFVGVR